MGKKLLVADDSVTIQKVIKLALSSEGYDILAVSDGKEAIRAIQEERPDVVLIDVTLPGADAYAVKRLANADPQLTHIGFILMLSAFERVDEKAIDEVRFQGRLIKPFDPSHLRKAVSDFLNKKADEDESVGGDFPKIGSQAPILLDETPAKITEEEFEAESEEAAPLGENLMIQPPMAPPPPPPAVTEPDTESEDEVAEAAEAAATKSLENDIKNLTESTIKMSGLDEFQWNLDDSRKMKTGKQKTNDERTIEIARPSGSAKGAALKTLMTAPATPLDDGGSTFPLSSLGNKAKTSPPPAQSASAGASGMTRAEIEQLVRKDVEAAVERIAKDAVPKIAEAIIRQEIEKILNEP